MEKIVFLERPRSSEEKFWTWPVIVLASAITVFYGLGLYAIIKFLVLEPETVVMIGGLLGDVGELVIQNIGIIFLLLVVLVLLTFILVPLMLKAIAKFGREVMIGLFYAFPIVMIAIGVLAVFIGTLLGIVFALLGIMLGVVFLFFFYRIRERISLGGRVLEISASSIVDELGAIVPSILFGLFSILTGIFATAAGYLVWDWLVIVENDIARGVVVFLLELVYVWIVFSVMYLTDGTIIGIINDWYRNPGIDRANLRKGFSRAINSASSIIKFSFVMALLATIARTARRMKPREKASILAIIGIAIAKIVSALAYGLAEFITYFTLPAIVIEGFGFKDGIKRSYSLIREYWVDVLVAFLGIGTVYGVFTILMLALYGVSGLAVGLFLVAPALVTEIPPLTIAGVTAILFVLLGFIPAYFLFRPIKVAYNTILYNYAVDKERNFELPSRLPEDLKRQFQTIMTRERTTPKIERWPKLPFDVESTV